MNRSLFELAGVTFQGSATDGLIAATGGSDIHTHVIDYVRKNGEAMVAYAQQTGDEFWKQASKIAATFMDDRQIDFINRVNDKVDRGERSVTLLSTFDEFQTAGAMMREFIMAYPEIQRMTEMGVTAGYAPYSFAQSHIQGTGNTNFMRVADGHFIDEPRKDDGYFYECSYDAPPEYRPLTAKEKRTILQTWENLQTMLLNGDGDDPLSLLCEEIGDIGDE